jgi:hypothetical protein
MQQERPRLAAASLDLQALIAWRRAAYSEAREMAERARELGGEAWGEEHERTLGNLRAKAG